MTTPTERAKAILTAITEHPETALPILTELCQTVEDLKRDNRNLIDEAIPTPTAPITGIDIGELW